MTTAAAPSSARILMNSPQLEPSWKRSWTMCSHLFPGPISAPRGTGSTSADFRAFVTRVRGCARRRDDQACAGTVMAESLFATVETEFYYRRIWTSRKWAKLELGTWIEDRYNLRAGTHRSGKSHPWLSSCNTQPGMRNLTKPHNRCPPNGGKASWLPPAEGYAVSTGMARSAASVGRPQLPHIMRPRSRCVDFWRSSYKRLVDHLGGFSHRRLSKTDPVPRRFLEHNRPESFHDLRC